MDHDLDTLTRAVANLRLQLAALDKATHASSIPEAVARMRRAVTWSAAAIAVALLVSALVTMYTNSRALALEQRVDTLERAPAREAP